MKANEEVCLGAVTQRGNVIEYLSAELNANEGVCLGAVAQHGYVIEYLSPVLRANEIKVGLAAAAQTGSAIHHLSFQYLSAELKKWFTLQP